MKERITITLDSNLLKLVDGQVDGKKLKNRSAVIESIVMDKFEVNRPKKAFILAGGHGTRLRPITQEIPKPMLPIHGRPILEHLIEFFKKNGIKEIILSVGFKKEVIMDYFGDGKKLGVNIRYVAETTPLGTAGPLLRASDLLTETFVLSNGDELKDFDLSDMYLFHKRNNAMATIALTQVDNPEEYGAVRLQGTHIVEFIEKSKGPLATRMINAGLYILEPSVLRYVKKGKCMMEKHVFPVLAKEQKLYGYPFVGQWFDTGTFERYESAIKKWRGVGHGNL